MCKGDEGDENIKKIKIGFLVLLFVLFVSSVSNVYASGVVVRVYAPAFRQWYTASTRYKETTSGQNVDFISAENDRGLCVDITDESGSGSNYYALCGYPGDTAEFTSSIVKYPDQNYDLHVKTIGWYFTVTDAVLLWEYDIE